MALTVLSAAAAMKNLRVARAVKWPDGRKGDHAGRLGLIARVDVNAKFKFSKDDTILTIGSCFAREIEKCLLELGFRVPLTDINIPPAERVSSAPNDIINKYVPQAMANELRWAFDPSARFPEDGYLQLGDNEWHDPHLGANLSPAPLERIKQRRAEVFAAYEQARNAKVVVVTLGLIEAWFDKQTNLYLNAAPPAKAIAAYPDRFDFHLLSYDQVLESLEDIHAILSRHGHPDFKMILTVSPVPFKATFTGRDALMANTYSKSVLRAAAECFTGRHQNVDYFPSYEIVTLSDRSVAFHVDNIHVRAEVVMAIMAQVVEKYTGLTLERPETPEVPKPAELNPRTMYGYARALGKARDYVTACQVMRSIEDSFGDDQSGVSPAVFHAAFGVWLLRANQTVTGDAHLQKSLALDPTNARVHYKHGLALARLKRSEAALDAFKTAITLAPRVPDYHWRMGEEYRALNRKDEAVAALREALVVDAGYQPARASLSRMAAQ